MDTEVAKEKILKYCAYQERSQKEVKNKLYEMGLYTGQVNEILVYLIQEDYLNEERFAFLYAGSKMRQKKWGRIKIGNELKMKGVGAKLVSSALAKLNHEQYMQNIADLTEKKDRTHTYKNEYERKQKLIRYLMSKGYVWSEIEIAMDDFFATE